MSLVECVPNISEGRHRDVIDRCATAIRNTTGVRLLDVSADPAHNRSVLTFAGEADPVETAALALAAAAVQEIDLRQHSGVHPRIGAVDVLPFVPLGETPMAACVAMARRVAGTLAERHGLPIFLYEAAALRSDRRNLADIRRGEFEGLASRLAGPDGRPDFGPARPHPTAGATAVGARGVLIAFNVNLATDRLDVARAVARAVRERSGGLPGVKALGVPLAHRGLVQVTMNLTDFRVTPPHVALARVIEEAGRHGVTIADCEVVGLTPAGAMTAAGAVLLQLAAFDDRTVLECALRDPPAWLA